MSNLISNNWKNPKNGWYFSHGLGLTNWDGSWPKHKKRLANVKKDPHRTLLDYFIVPQNREFAANCSKLPFYGHFDTWGVKND